MFTCANKTFPFPKYAYSYHFAADITFCFATYKKIAYSSLLLWFCFGNRQFRFCFGNRLYDSLGFALVTGYTTAASLTVCMHAYLL